MVGCPSDPLMVATPNPSANRACDELIPLDVAGVCDCDDGMRRVHCHDRPIAACSTLCQRPERGPLIDAVEVHRQQRAAEQRADDDDDSADVVSQAQLLATIGGLIILYLVFFRRRKSLTNAERLQRFLREQRAE